MRCAPTPAAQVADNDLAFGRIVEGLSKSKFWPQMAIFVVEDDAQNGPDHVDAHRTVGFVISPWCKRGFVDSTLYTTASMIRTMELTSPCRRRGASAACGGASALCWPASPCGCSCWP